VSALFAGIDGGQSSTHAIIGDMRGRILGRGSAGPCDEIGQTAQSTRLADALHAALHDACRAAGLSQGTQFEVIVAAISGYEGRIYGAAPQLLAANVLLVHDALAAHAGALGGAPGVIAIAGTGSVVYGRTDVGDEATFGGWGYLFGDEGSGFWIARQTLAALMTMEDIGDASRDDARSAALHYFGTQSLHSIARGFYSGEISRERLAGFAPVVLQTGNFEATVEKGAAWLGALAVRALDALQLDRAALCGGLFRERSYYDAVANAIVQRLPQTQIVPPKYEPVVGALLLAYNEAALPVGELHL
jgi:N-acetylglucosamine kinase-like BadF-type ATPase